MSKVIITMLALTLIMPFLEAEESKKPKIAVFDFSTIDIQGQKFYEFKDRSTDQGVQDSLSQADRDVIDMEMLGYVKMIDAASETERRRHERERADKENDRNRARYEALADKILKSQMRSVVIGSEFMIAELKKYNNLEVVDRKNIDNAFKELEFGRSGAVNEEKVAEFGNMTGATHILYATVADFQTKERKFSGYGVKTNSIQYSLDVIVKVVDIESQQVVFSTIVTGSQKEFKTEFGEEVNSDRFKDLMKSAVAKAAFELHESFANQKTQNAKSETEEK